MDLEEPENVEGDEFGQDNPVQDQNQQFQRHDSLGSDSERFQQAPRGPPFPQGPRGPGPRMGFQDQGSQGPRGHVAQDLGTPDRIQGFVVQGPEWVLIAKSQQLQQGHRPLRPALGRGFEDQQPRGPPPRMGFDRNQQDAGPRGPGPRAPRPRMGFDPDSRDHAPQDWGPRAPRPRMHGPRPDEDYPPQDYPPRLRGPRPEQAGMPRPRPGHDGPMRSAQFGPRGPGMGQARPRFPGPPPGNREEEFDRRNEPGSEHSVRQPQALTPG